jgi:hypothetical protein
MLKNARNIFISFCVGLILSSCSTAPSEHTFPGAPIPEGSYSDALERWTDSKKVYSGIIAAFEVTATLNSLPIIEHQVYLDSVKSRSTTQEYTDARKKALDEARSQTTFFVMLYTDKDENNDLDKLKNFWNIFLDVDGKRLMPKSVKKVYENKARLQDRYSYLNPWGKSYIVTFAVPAGEITTRTSTLTMASTLGAAILKFPQ